MAVVTRYPRKRRGVITNPPATDTVPMRASDGWADKIVAGCGVVCHPGGPYNGPDTADALTRLGWRHVRMGLVNVGNAPQRALAVAIADAGAKMSGICDDRGVQTPTSRINECLTYWRTTAGVLALEYIENCNEPQRKYANPAAWPLTIATNGPNSADDLLGVNEVRRQMPLVRAAQQALAPTIPVIAPSMASKNQTGWYTKLGTGLEAHADIANIHVYAAAWSMLANPNGPGVNGYVSESRTTTGPSAPVHLTETGYHNLQPNLSGHAGVPESVAGVYGPRGLFEILYAPGVGPELIYFYELFNEPALGAAPQPEAEWLQAHFGLYKMVGGVLTAKPIALGFERIKALFNDPSTAPGAPVGRRLEIVTSGTDVKSALHTRRNGTHLLALWRPVSIWSPTTETTLNPAGVNVTVNLGLTAAAVNIWQPSVSATATATYASTTSVTHSLAGHLAVIEIGVAGAAGSGSYGSGSYGGGSYGE